MFINHFIFHFIKLITIIKQIIYNHRLNFIIFPLKFSKFFKFLILFKLNFHFFKQEI